MRTNYLLPLLLVAVSSFSQKISIPFFQPLEKSQLCGTTNCCPSRGEGCEGIRGGYFFVNSVNELGRAVTGEQTIHSSRAFAKPTENDIETSLSQKISGTLETNKKNEFKINLEANFDSFLSTLNLDQNTKAELKLNFSKSVDNTLNSSIDMVVKIQSLSKDFLDNNVYNRKVTQETYVITGLTYLSLTGQWSSNTIKKALLDFEASATYGKLDATAKGKYDSLKKTVLSAEFNISALAFRVSYETLTP